MKESEIRERKVGLDLKALADKLEANPLRLLSRTQEILHLQECLQESVEALKELTGRIETASALAKEEMARHFDSGRLFPFHILQALKGKATP